MIQRKQSLFLLTSIIASLLLYFLPLGYLDVQDNIKFTVCGYFNEEGMIQFNWLLSSILSLTMLLQFIAIFLYKNRTRQALLTQISLILILLFGVSALLYQDLFISEDQAVLLETEIRFHWSLSLVAIAWISTYLALRGIKKDEALIRAADRMR